MRVAIVSDIHGNVRGLDACLADLAEQGGADTIVGAGDLCMDGARSREVLERLRDIGARCIRGNTDREIADDPGKFDEETAADIRWQQLHLGTEWLAWLRSLPEAIAVGDPSNELLICHANPRNDDEHVWPDATDEQLERLFTGVRATAIAFGHLHLPYARIWRGKLLVNVASAGLPKDGDERVGYAILTERSGGWEVKHRRVPFDVEEVARELETSDMPGRKEHLKVLRRHRYKELGAVIP
ncbi:MAG TPA: metallophosphoesterase family protein [Candidatus Binatia bacterium]|nr:metallophosphoesterase family protein [Candidatus Binatia bacterium]